MSAAAEKVSVQWANGCTLAKNLPTATVETLDQKGFYAILSGEKNPLKQEYNNIRLLYIGQAFDQTIRERVQQKHDAYSDIQKLLKSNPKLEILVMCGAISTSTATKITQQLFNDIEGALIFDNKPSFNTLNRDSYNGRGISITNVGDYSPLKQSTALNPPA